METIHALASHLRRIQADSIETWGDEDHTAGKDSLCENCYGHYIEGVDRCAQYHLCKLLTGNNPFKYLEETRL